MTGLDLVKAALRIIGVKDPDEAPTGSESATALASINRMISSWANERLMIYNVSEDTHTLVAGTASYTIGSSGDINTTRPQWIETAFIRDSTQTPAYDRPLRIINNREYSEIPTKGLSSSYPSDMYVNAGYPLMTLVLYPTPSTAHTLVIRSAKELTQIASLATALSLPNGYEDALVWNSAVQLAPEYGKQPDVVTIQRSVELKAGIKRVNYEPSYLRVDNALSPGYGGSFDINTGEPTR